MSGSDKLQNRTLKELAKDTITVYMRRLLERERFGELRSLNDDECLGLCAHAYDWSAFASQINDNLKRNNFDTSAVKPDASGQMVLTMYHLLKIDKSNRKSLQLFIRAQKDDKVAIYYRKKSTGGWGSWPADQNIAWLTDHEENSIRLHEVDDEASIPRPRDQRWWRQALIDAISDECLAFCNSVSQDQDTRTILSSGLCKRTLDEDSPFWRNAEKDVPSTSLSTYPYACFRLDSSCPSGQGGRDWTVTVGVSYRGSEEEPLTETFTIWTPDRQDMQNSAGPSG